MRALSALKALLWFIAVYQFACGFLLLMPPGFAQLVVGWYGATVNWTDQFTFILKPLGAYMLMTGLIAASSARATVPHPTIVTSLAVLFTVNALYRILRFQFVQQTFGIASWHLIGQIVVLLGLAGGLMLLSRAAVEATGAVAGDAPKPVGAGA
jgi:hypothetical protein